jgi:hypothetical protein
VSLVVREVRIVGDRCFSVLFLVLINSAFSFENIASDGKMIDELEMFLKEAAVTQSR